jgi:hypothetical protein
MRKQEDFNYGKPIDKWWEMKGPGFSLENHKNTDYI